MSEKGKQNQLHLVLKSEWYDMTEADIKHTEYRDMTMLYSVKFKNFFRKNGIKHYVTEDETFIGVTEGELREKPVFVCLHRGYTQQTIVRRITMVDFGPGLVEWGAEPGKFYYRIHYGREINKK